MGRAVTGVARGRRCARWRRGRGTYARERSPPPQAHRGRAPVGGEKLRLAAACPRRTRTLQGRARLQGRRQRRGQPAAGRSRPTTRARPTAPRLPRRSSALTTPTTRHVTRPTTQPKTRRRATSSRSPRRRRSLRLRARAHARRTRRIGQRVKSAERLQAAARRTLRWPVVPACSQPPVEDAGAGASSFRRGHGSASRAALADAAMRSAAAATCSFMMQ